MTDDRSSNVDFEDCGDCADEEGSGICSNCEDDGTYCSECHGTGRCTYCQGTGRRKIEVDPEVLRQVEAAGPLIVPDEEALSDDDR